MNKKLVTHRMLLLKLVTNFINFDTINFYSCEFVTSK